MAAAGRKLAASVILDGTVYLAGQTVPADVAEQITNPKAWGEKPAAPAKAPSAPASNADETPTKGKAGKESKQAADPAEAPAEAPTGADAPEGAGAAGSDDAGADQTGSDDELTPPPLTGKGSSGDAWRTYAVAAATKAGLNIEIPEDAKRDEIVAALDASGIQTQPKE